MSLLVPRRRRSGPLNSPPSVCSFVCPSVRTFQISESDHRFVPIFCTKLYMTRSQILVWFHSHFLCQKSTSHTFSEKSYKPIYYGQFGYVDSEKYRFNIRKLMKNIKFSTFLWPIGPKMANFGSFSREKCLQRIFLQHWFPNKTYQPTFSYF